MVTRACNRRMLATWYPFTCTIGTEFLVVYQENSKLEDEN